ncbi:transposable element Tc1 transposase [Trichonephila clavipes]|nr:transposable element Tc1 transposase [Trichonephila clavipes]
MRSLEEIGKNGWRMADFSVVMVAVDLEPHEESRLQLYPNDHRGRVWRSPEQRGDPAFTIARHTGLLQEHTGLIFQQDNTRLHTVRVAINCLIACETLTWSARSPDLSPIEHVWDMLGKRLHLTRNIHVLARQLVKNCQEIPQETKRVLYFSIARSVTARFQAAGMSTPY